MTNEQAIKIIKEERAWESSERIKNAFDLAIKALEKTVAKKPIIRGLGQRYCSTCGCGGADSDFCSKCGQKLEQC